MLKKYGGYLYPLIIIFLLFLTYIIFYSYNNYVDPFNLCVINIDQDTQGGNRKTIQAALGKLKNTDKSSYEDVCRHVSLISENFCPIYHTYGGSWQYNNQPGCYIKGSKIIYINPTKENTDSIIDQRAEAIKKYANFSKDYWLNFP